MSEEISVESAKYRWLRYVSCSEASMTTQMRGFGINELAYEQAIHVFSGGFMHRGHACGLLTGAVLAAGFVARSRFDDDRLRSGAALYTAIQLTMAYSKLTGSVNCLEITDVSLMHLSGRLRYLQQGKDRMCGGIHLKWATQAQQLIDSSLVAFSHSRQTGPFVNCAVRTLRELVVITGMKAEDAVLVAGFSGGVGLCGNVCGALTAAVFAMSAGHQLVRKQKQRDSRIRGALEELTGSNYRGAATRLRRDFVQQFGSELCADIIGRRFQDIDDYSIFIEQGRCDKVIKFVADRVAVYSEVP